MMARSLKNVRGSKFFESEWSGGLQAMPLGQRVGDNSESRYCGVEISFDEDIHTALAHNLAGGFDFVLAPLTDPHYRPSQNEPNTSTVPPFAGSDLVLSPAQWSSHVVGKISSWIDLDSSNEMVRADSEITLKQELAWATHLSLQSDLNFSGAPMASGEGQSNPSTSGDAGGDHNEDYDNEYGPPLPTQKELREMEHRRLVGEATSMMLNFAKDPKLAKYMTETAFQDVHAQWKETTTSPPKPDSKKQHSEKELEQEVEARLARILGAQDKGKKHDKKRKKSTDFPGYLGSVIEGDYNIFKSDRAVHCTHMYTLQAFQGGGRLMWHTVRNPVKRGENHGTVRTG
ncbi:hypothetical protein L7F22_045967 [Adiantum nelumboides]|nr:hypothetical protein [Adiantum nelumboides]